MPIVKPTDSFLLAAIETQNGFGAFTQNGLFTQLNIKGTSSVPSQPLPLAPNTRRDLLKTLNIHPLDVETAATLTSWTADEFVLISMGYDPGMPAMPELMTSGHWHDDPFIQALRSRLILARRAIDDGHRRLPVAPKHWLEFARQAGFALDPGLVKAVEARHGALHDRTAELKRLTNENKSLRATVKALQSGPVSSHERAGRTKQLQSAYAVIYALAHKDGAYTDGALTRKYAANLASHTVERGRSRSNETVTKILNNALLSEVPDADELD